MRDYPTASEAAADAAILALPALLLVPMHGN